MKTSLDKFGRVVIPKEVRDELGLEPGTTLAVREEGREIVLTPVQEGPNLVLEEGVLVFAGRATGDIAGAVGALRSQRLRALARWKGT
jgi:AbrB family looped-hinge helix DNA binding protein